MSIAVRPIPRFIYFEFTDTNPLCQGANEWPSRFIRSRAPRRGFGHPSSLSTIVCRALRRAGLQPDLKGAHILRHSLATGMLRGGASMAEIGQVLRHRAPNTTEIYAKVDMKGLRSLALPWPMKGGAS